MRATEFHFDCSSSLGRALARAEGRELELTCAEGLAENDWLMVIVRIPSAATCLAARVVVREAPRGSPEPRARYGVEFAEHDWERLLALAALDEADRSEPSGRQTPPCSVGPPSDANVLVVHDDPEVAGVLRKMLGSHGFRATWVSGPHEALDSLRRQKVDLVLADWMPRGMPGLEFCAALRSECASSTASRPPILFLACPSARADRQAALRAGAGDFVVLPFRWSELDARLLSLLHRCDRAELVSPR